MSIAALTFDFEPLVRIGGLSIRLETLGVAAAIGVACLVAALVARRVPTDPARPDGPRLRADDALWVALATIPGAVAGGRLGYAALHLDFYAARPGALLDPGQGSLELTMAVVGGALTGGYAARLLAGSARPWFHAAALPMLLAIAGGKVAMALGGTGQGVPWDAAWATAYHGAGPWGSLAPGVASVPAQLVEAAATGVLAVALVGAAAAGAFRVPDGRMWLVALAGWAAIRVAVAMTWRDAPVLGPLRAEQLIAAAVAAACVIALASPRPWRTQASDAAGRSIVAADHRHPRGDDHEAALGRSEERT